MTSMTDDAQKAAHPHEAITGRLNAIAFLTDDEWEVSEDEDVEEYEVFIRSPHPSVRTVICEPRQNRALADFLANTPRDIRWLLDEVVKWEGRTADTALIVAKASQLANEWGDGVSPECSEFADALQDILERA